MRILYVATISNTINAFLVPHIEFLVQQGHKVDVACRIVHQINPRLEEIGCTVYNIPFDRTPWKPQNLKAYKSLKKIIDKGKYHIVHTHTPVASACVRLACRKGKAKVVYTAHGFHFYAGAPIKNWLIYYPVERYLSCFTDVIITINEEDFQNAKERFFSKSIEYIPGVGIDISKFRDVVIDRSLKRRELGIPEHAFLVLSVGELNKNKNHETVIKAIAQLRDQRIYYAICGQGRLEAHLRKLSFELGIQDQVKLLGYRSDIPEIYKAADLFIFPSYREGLPVSLLEAMASGLPIICSDIRGNRDLMKNNKNSLMIKPNDVSRLSSIIQKMVNEAEFRNQAVHQPFEIEKYAISNVLRKLKLILEI